MRRATRRARRQTAGAAAALLALAAAARRADAQAIPQVRADVLLGERAAAHAGGGLEVDAGLYTRVGLVGTGGVVRLDDGGSGLGGRAEVVMRFLLDPLRQSRTGAYLAGGAGVRVEADARARAFVLGVLGVEWGGRRGGWAPSVELGVGGGARLGLVLRRARADRR